jgi:hypothetical protein
MEGCDGPSKLLLYFYAVECGLKHLLVKRSNCRKTDELHRNPGHDLRGLLKALKVSKSMTGSDTPQHFRLHRDRNESYRISEVHQAWRYGIGVEERDESRIIEYLDRIKNWIEGSV